MFSFNRILCHYNIKINFIKKCKRKSCSLGMNKIKDNFLTNRNKIFIIVNSR